MEELASKVVTISTALSVIIGAIYAIFQRVFGEKLKHDDEIKLLQIIKLRGEIKELIDSNAIDKDELEKIPNTIAIAQERGEQNIESKKDFYWSFGLLVFPSIFPMLV
ncbi:MAG: hypothetical protein ACR2RE_11750, partial [Geminicoccaceae bacterium]